MRPHSQQEPRQQQQQPLLLLLQQMFSVLQLLQLLLHYRQQTLADQNPQKEGRDECGFLWDEIAATQITYRCCLYTRDTTLAGAAVVATVASVCCFQIFFTICRTSSSANSCPGNKTYTAHQLYRHPSSSKDSNSSNDSSSSSSSRRDSPRPTCWG